MATKERITSEYNQPGVVKITTSPVDYSPESVKKLCYESLVDMVAGAKGDIKSLAAVNATLDRLIGKAVQPVAADVKIRDADKPVDREAILRRWQFLNKIEGVVVD